MISSVSTSSLSASLVAYFGQKGKTLREIGEMVGLSESFISRVANGERSFTIDHLGAFEKKLGEPLPALLLQTMWGHNLPAEQQPAFDDALRLLRELGEFRHSLGAVEASKQSTLDHDNKHRAPSRGKRAAG